MKIKLLSIIVFLAASFQIAKAQCPGGTYSANTTWTVTSGQGTTADGTTIIADGNPIVINICTDVITFNQDGDCVPNDYLLGVAPPLYPAGFTVTGATGPAGSLLDPAYTPNGGSWGFGDPYGLGDGWFYTGHADGFGFGDGAIFADNDDVNCGLPGFPPCNGCGDVTGNSPNDNTTGTFCWDVTITDPSIIDPSDPLHTSTTFLPPDFFSASVIGDVGCLDVVPGNTCEFVITGPADAVGISEEVQVLADCTVSGAGYLIATVDDPTVAVGDQVVGSGAGDPGPDGFLYGVSTTFQNIVGFYVDGTTAADVQAGTATEIDLAALPPNTGCAPIEIDFVAIATVLDEGVDAAGCPVIGPNHLFEYVEPMVFLQFPDGSFDLLAAIEIVGGSCNADGSYNPTTIAFTTQGATDCAGLELVATTSPDPGCGNSVGADSFSITFTHASGCVEDFVAETEVFPAGFVCACAAVCDATPDYSAPDQCSGASTVLTPGPACTNPVSTAFPGDDRYDYFIGVYLDAAGLPAQAPAGYDPVSVSEDIGAFQGTTVPALGDLAIVEVSSNQAGFPNGSQCSTPLDLGALFVNPTCAPITVSLVVTPFDYDSDLNADTNFGDVITVADGGCPSQIIDIVINPIFEIITDETDGCNQFAGAFVSDGAGGFFDQDDDGEITFADACMTEELGPACDGATPEILDYDFSALDVGSCSGALTGTLTCACVTITCDGDPDYSAMDICSGDDITLTPGPACTNPESVAFPGDDRYDYILGVYIDGAGAPAQAPAGYDPIPAATIDAPSYAEPNLGVLGLSSTVTGFPNGSQCSIPLAFTGFTNTTCDPFTITLIAVPVDYDSDADGDTNFGDVVAIADDGCPAQLIDVIIYPNLTETITPPDCAGTAGSAVLTAEDATECENIVGTAGTANVCPDTNDTDATLAYDFTSYTDPLGCFTGTSGIMPVDCNVACPNVCDIIVVASTPVCDDAGTDSDPSDDTYTFTVTVTNSDQVNFPTFTDDMGNAAQAYGAVVNYGPFPISGDPVTVNYTDDTDPLCVDGVTVAPPATCSNVAPPMCSISAAVVRMCDDGGTPEDGSNDMTTYMVTVTGSNTGATFNATVAPDDTNPAGGVVGTTGLLYGTTYVYNQTGVGAFNVVFTDVDDTDCTATINQINGCETVENIPTVGEWGLIILGLLMSITAIVGIRQRREEEMMA